ncbi:MAG: hypothetical protein HYS98_08070 [Deltaproteobacteria bacterium]|nr:hypothetical protein [Deltaproteobacteria bacterium]
MNLRNSLFIFVLLVGFSSLITPHTLPASSGSQSHVFNTAHESGFKTALKCVWDEFLIFKNDIKNMNQSTAQGVGGFLLDLPGSDIKEAITEIRGLLLEPGKYNITQDLISEDYFQNISQAVTKLAYLRLHMGDYFETGDDAQYQLRQFQKRWDGENLVDDSGRIVSWKVKGQSLGGCLKKLSQLTHTKPLSPDIGDLEVANLTLAPKSETKATVENAAHVKKEGTLKVDSSTKCSHDAYMYSIDLWNLWLGITNFQELSHDSNMKQAANNLRETARSFHHGNVYNNDLHKKIKVAVRHLNIVMTQFGEIYSDPADQRLQSKKWEKEIGENLKKVESHLKTIDSCMAHSADKKTCEGKKTEVDSEFSEELLLKMRVLLSAKAREKRY